MCCDCNGIPKIFLLGLLMRPREEDFLPQSPEHGEMLGEARQRLPGALLHPCGEQAGDAEP